MDLSSWQIDAAHSGINFSVRHLVIAKVRGRFGKFSGTVRTADADPTQTQIVVEIDASSIDTGVADRDTHLKSGDFFDVQSFPQLRFESTRIESAGGERYHLIGDLTIKGVTREVVLDVEYAGRAKDPWGNERAAARATGAIDRRDFGLGWNQVLEAGGVLVGERVEIEIEVQAIAAAATKAA
jgi:polyisoprenoid-binding protein YceI